MSSGQYERKIVRTGHSNRETSAQFGQYLVETVEDPAMESRWDAYVKAG